MSASKSTRRRSVHPKGARHGEKSGNGEQSLREWFTRVFEGVGQLTKARNKRRMGLALGVLLTTVATIFLIKTTLWGGVRSDLVETTQLRRAQVLPVEPKRRRKKERRKHLHEICPHIVKRIPSPYSNKYVVSAGPKPTASIPRDLVSVTKGDIPVIISVPHGASPKETSFSWQTKHLPTRAGASETFNATDFQSRLSRVSTDTKTIELGKEITAAFKKKYSKSPYLVVAKVHRKYVDLSRRVNGSEACCKAMWPKCTAVAEYRYHERSGRLDETQAQKVNTARKVYDLYHSSIISVINEISQKHPGKPIFLVDVHAQKASDEPDLGVTAEDFLETIIVGTQDGRLVQDRAQLYSPGGVLHTLKKGVNIYPPDNKTPDHTKYNGGHLVAEYGFNNTVGAVTNALQMEFGFNLRVKTKGRAKAVNAVVAALNAAISQ